MVLLRSEQKEFYLGWKFLTSLGTVLQLLYPGLDYAALLTFTSILCAAGYEVASYNSGKMIGKFYTVLLSGNQPQFWNLFWKATLIYLGQSLLFATTTFSTSLLYLAIRRNLVIALHRLYYRKSAYFQLNGIDNAGIDNPDQRITQDAERMCSTLAKNIFPYLPISPAVIAWYTYITWSTAGGFGVAIIYFYFIIGVVANRILVSPLTKWTARVEKCEGDFRYKHVTVRKNAEESAFFDAAEFEEYECNRFLSRLLERQFVATLWKYPAQFLQNIFDFYGAILSYMIQIFPIFIFNSYEDLDPPMLAQRISNNSFYFIYLIHSFTRLTDLALALGEMAGYTQRIAELIRHMRCINSVESIDWSESTDQEDSPNLLVTENLSYSTPGKLEELVSDLSLKVPKNKTLLITGTSGVGKTSFMRVIRKLWKPTAGTIVRNFTPQNSMFVPQRPYLPPGQLSLRQQIVFPMIDDQPDSKCIDNSKIVNILEALHLRSLITMCGGLTDPSDFEWQDTLSPGEQQRLSMARVLFHSPSYVFLDEATSSLSVDAEANVYDLLKKYGIMYVSTGHRPTLRSFHDLELRLHGKNDWKLIENVKERTENSDN
ncbi:hypothetical protein Aduo_017790 [Ancylostoma duodenale]